jgi:hypothetical protein
MATKEGDFINLFPFPNPPYCPVAALTKLYWQQKEAGLARPTDAVFTYNTGKQLTREGLNSALKAMLEPLFDFREGSYSCHSFRGGTAKRHGGQPGGHVRGRHQELGPLEQQCLPGLHAPKAGPEEEPIQQNC